ncbi:hypothetical protein N0V93_005823 [Gnomoniopsis smithogilvyi]|uniref:Rhodopsin domain-containing protein n=1 Tax=Gnomoniopsis smithogilvyi TaxID=1191159 RepID=A0A9W8YVF4_9PEZI|nr:hypothetical protein N0V93_005823 [Gnomoniopsis smithogilvyi]
MAANSTSAFVGNPPNTERDYYIVRGMDRTYGASSADPADGFTYLAAAPSDYVHETKSVQVIIGLVIMMVTILIPTVARLVLRASNPAMEFGSDDWAIILAASVALLYSIVHILIIVQGGGGYHIWEVTYEQYNSFVYWANVATMLYYVAVSLIKVSITLFLRRIAHQAFLPWRIACDIFLASLALYVVYVMLSTSIYCKPVQAGWSLELSGQLEQPAKCIDEYRNAEALSIVHLIQGTILLCSPLIMLWKVRMSRSKKIRLYSFWIVGGLAVLGALLDFLLQNVSSDYTWSYTSIITWAAIDICFGMLTASLPVLDAFIEDVWRSTRRKISTGRHSRGDVHGDSQSNPPVAGPWTDKHAPISQENVVATCAHRSESQEHFVQAEDTIEMGNMSAQDNEVRSSMVYTTESSGKTPSR